MLVQYMRFGSITRIVIPSDLTSKLIEVVREAYPGIVGTKQRLRERYCW